MRDCGKNTARAALPCIRPGPPQDTGSTLLLQPTLCSAGPQPKCTAVMHQWARCRSPCFFTSAAPGPLTLHPSSDAGSPQLRREHWASTGLQQVLSESAGAAWSLVRHSGGSEAARVICGGGGGGLGGLRNLWRLLRTVSEVTSSIPELI